MENRGTKEIKGKGDLTEEVQLIDKKSKSKVVGSKREKKKSVR